MKAVSLRQTGQLEVLSVSGRTPDSEFHRRETTLLASRNAVAADFTRFIGLIESGRLDTTLWIIHTAARPHRCLRSSRGGSTRSSAM
jgi:threonine dehydrogenase-like Zn-dependent dehydrogenase